MPILHFFDRETITGSLALPLDPELHQLLAERVAHLTEQGLLDMTVIVVITATTSEAELIEAIGFTPLVDIDGNRFGERDFHSDLDYVTRVSRNYHEAIAAVGDGGFAYHLLVHRRATSELIELCRSLSI